MRSRFLPALLLPGLLLFAGVAFACGGGDENDNEQATATEEKREATPTQNSSAQPTEEAGPTSASSAVPFDSYHYTVALEFSVADPQQTDQTSFSGKVEGDFVAPNSHAFTSSFEFSGLTVSQEAVIIGDDAWFREGGGDWSATTASDPQVQDALSLTSADPGFLQDQQFADDISALNSEPESRNGVETRRYHIPKEAVATLSELLGQDFLQNTAGLQDFEMTVWLDKETDGLVRAEFTATASPDVFGADAPFALSSAATVNITMTINLTQINDEGIEIKAPI